jgi:hypothetical protein
MDPITLGLAFGALAALGSRVAPQNDTPEGIKQIETEVKKRLSDASLITVPPESSWVQVELNGQKWLVAPRYIAPVGIGEANAIANKLGYQLPTVALVDAIYKASDLKLDPHPRGQYDKPPSDFTAKTMNSADTNIAQLAHIQKQIEAAGNPEYKLLAGTHKDVVYDAIPFGENAGKMHLGIYGWHQRNGKPIQGFMWGHADNYPANDWKDYSQGLRLVKKIS